MLNEVSTETAWVKWEPDQNLLGSGHAAATLPAYYDAPPGQLASAAWTDDWGAGLTDTSWYDSAADPSVDAFTALLDEVTQPSHANSSYVSRDFHHDVRAVAQTCFDGETEEDSDSAEDD